MHKIFFTREEARERGIKERRTRGRKGRKGGRETGSRGSGDMERNQGYEKERGDRVGGSSGRLSGRAGTNPRLESY